MSRHHIVDQFGDVITTPSHRKVLDCTDSQVATGHSGQDRAGLDTIANDGLTGCNRGQSAVVGTPNACMASDTTYSRITGPMGERPSPPRE